MLFQTGQSADGGPFAGLEYLDFSAQFTLAAGATLATGQVLCRDITQIIGSNGTSQTGNLPDVVVLPGSANAGRNYGAYQGPPIVNPSSTSTLTVYIPIRQKGAGLVLASATAAGTAVTVGATLVTNPTVNNNVAVGAFATGKTVGMAIATAINTTSAAAVTAGAARVVTPGSMVGISTSTPLVIDNAQSGVQETVTPTAITSTTFTATFANSHNTGFSITGAATAPGAVLIPVPGTGTVSGLVVADFAM